ncbi:capsular polysaccharide synthesis protein [Psychrobacter sp. HD31]|uniref:capsular polysaccharide synthesis protein n=1 Tax=Psychrobacter sp. HD31 TaxID=3112003 RepID=UPI003DA3690B
MNNYLKYLNLRQLNRIRRKHRKQQKMYQKSLQHKSYLNQYLCTDYIKFDGKIEQNLPIWQLWLQGKDNAPELIKNCFQSVEKHCPKRDIQVLTADNIYDYIQLPDYVIDKYNRSLISHTHFSDIVRVCLLCKYGGTWIDGTVLLTDQIEKKIEDAEFFCFSSPQDSINYRLHLISSWFIHSQKQHPFLLNVKESLFEYWKNENKLIDYFTFHLTFRNMIDASNELQRNWNDLYHLTNDTPHLFNKRLKERFIKEDFDSILTKSNIHKLTHKIGEAEQDSYFSYFSQQKLLLP